MSKWDRKLGKLEQELAETEVGIKYYGGIGRKKPDIHSLSGGASSSRPHFDNIMDSFKWDWSQAKGDREMEAAVRKVYVDALLFGHRGYKNREAASKEVDRWARRLETEEVS
ncbi:MAG: hypothetical protein KKH61_20150 [Gammaproteobacteria bacterium]|nr:hypothetical protein [Gammaproteobacteria bacterium]